MHIIWTLKMNRKVLLYIFADFWVNGLTWIFVSDNKIVYCSRERERLLYVCQISVKLSMFLGWFHQHLTFSLVVQLCCCIFGANFKLKCFLTFFVVKLKYHLSAYYCFGKHCMELLLWDELTFLSNTIFFSVFAVNLEYCSVSTYVS